MRLPPIQSLQNPTRCAPMNSQLGTWESIPPPHSQIPETPNFTTYFPRSPAEEGISLPPQITRPAPLDFETPALQRAKRMHVSSMPSRTLSFSSASSICPPQFDSTINVSES
ncbi:hypothetical protein CROQUDRAFT_665594 [Cronartium quercuum f. sp. fusiforme G11]|uniref:Uncharacterized protein n=1 Tax=Cronartium quercuum f. sp. fusiforme G11 TaxID=708437 RepID=A0A9P6T5V4_9BASI|nr:hypothetical protein CROQUDRAFT_665594 [Cronartium quercuum f. sp. fusiforme G11]